MIDYDPNYCPFCGSANMSYSDPTVTEQAKTIELPITCSKCHSKWTEVFTFSNAKLDSEL